MKYYGQVGLDTYIHKNFIKTPVKNGTFLELGAIDGLKFSNTKFFEDNMGFNKGVLIEPDPQSFQALKINRRNCECFNYAIHSTLNEVTFLQAPHRNAVGTVDEVASEEFKKHWHPSSKAIKLPATKLSLILAKSSLEYIDFWSLDTEGSELECLLSMDWNIPVGLLCIEINQNDEEIDDLLQSNGLHLAGVYERDPKNKIYINKEYPRKILQ